MIYLKLRQAGHAVNHKRVERLYQEASLQVRRRKRKKVPPAERQPLLRPAAANEVWSIDFVFDRTAEGRVIKCLSTEVNRIQAQRLHQGEFHFPLPMTRPSLSRSNDHASMSMDNMFSNHSRSTQGLRHPSVSYFT